jgi:hypothetical protein
MHSSWYCRSRMASSRTTGGVPAATAASVRRCSPGANAFRTLLDVLCSHLDKDSMLHRVDGAREIRRMSMVAKVRLCVRPILCREDARCKVRVSMQLAQLLASRGLLLLNSRPWLISISNLVFQLNVTSACIPAVEMVNIPKRMRGLKPVR